MASIFSSARGTRWCFALSWLLCATSAASAKDWDVTQALGPSGGTVWSVLPTSTSGQLYALTDGGLYRTRDSGAHWLRLESARFTATTVAADRVDADIVHATALDGKLYRSDNGGDAWQEEVFGAAVGEKALSVDTLAGQRGGAVVGSSANKVYNNRGAAGYFVDFDDSHENAQGITAVATDPLDAHLYFVILGNPYRGLSVVLRVVDGTVQNFPSLMMYGDYPYKIAVGSDGRLCLIYSQNATGCSVSGTDFGFQAVTTANNASVGLLSFALDPVDDTHVLGVGDGAHDIRGHTATSIFSGLTIGGVTQPVVESGAFDLNYATNGRLWLGTAALGVVTRAGIGPWQMANTGLNAYYAGAFAIDPRGKQRMVTSYWPLFVGSWPLQVTSNTGTTWTPKLGDQYYLATRAVVIDPTTAVGSAAPRIFAAGSLGGGGEVFGSNIYRSIDGGATWATLTEGLPPPQPQIGLGRNIGYVFGMVMDPRSCASPPAHGACTSGPLKTLIVAASGNSTGGFRVMRSRDAGATWTDVGNGLPAADLSAAHGEKVRARMLVAAADDHTVMYLGTEDWYTGNDGSPVQRSGVYRSDNGGVTWQWRSGGLPRRGNAAETVWTIPALAVTPNQPDQVWAVARGPDDIAANDHVYYSGNGGVDWSDRSLGITGTGCYVRTLLRDARAANLIYAGGGTASFTPCLFRSTDAGLHWFMLDTGAVAGSVQEIHADPDDPLAIVVSGGNGLVVLQPAPDLIFHSGMGD